MKFSDIRQPKRRCCRCKDYKPVLGGKSAPRSFTCAECRTDKKPQEVSHAA